MNVRMDRQLKEAGDAVLAHIGMTPSQAVRTLWEYLVVNGRMPSRSGIAVPSSNVPATASVESRVTQGSHIVRDACLKYGIPVPDLSGDYDDSMRKQWRSAIPSGWSYECRRHSQVAHRHQRMDGLLFWKVGPDSGCCPSIRDCRCLGADCPVCLVSFGQRCLVSCLGGD